MRNIYIKKGLCLLLLAVVSISLIGCGETVAGVGKDARRMGKGVKTIFVRDGAGE